MEDVLEVYERPRDKHRPLVCLDEFCKQLVGEVRPPLPAAPGQPRRYDYEYVRHGCASAFVIHAPLEGRREVYLGPESRRTTRDYAKALEFIATKMFPKAEKIILVEDNLNTHDDASLYATFSPAKARRLAQRFERHHTPKHGSWLNIAECEIAALVRTALPDRIASEKEFRARLRLAVRQRNQAQIGTNWQFTTKDARIKLKKLYPSILSR
jgi:hypothetical protein